MALSANVIIRKKTSPLILDLKLVSGAIHVYEGAILNYASGNIGYVKLGADALTNEFAGIAYEEKNIAAADNLSDGTVSIRTLSRGCGETIQMTLSADITIANEGDPVYVKGDDLVGTTATNTTGGLVGIIRQYISARQAWVQLVQHPNL